MTDTGGSGVTTLPRRTAGPREESRAPAEEPERAPAPAAAETPVAPGGRGAVWFAAAVLLVLSAVLFQRPLFGGETLFGRDIAPFFYPMKQFLAATVRSGQLPLWNPWILNGEPFFASLQPGLFYPGSVLLYLLPMPAAFDLLHAVHYPVAGVGMLLLLRSWRLPTPAALFGAVAFMLGGYFVSLGNFTNNLQTVALVPWLFWSWSRFLAGGGARAAGWFAVATAVAFLGGEPQMLAIALLLLFAHGVLDVEGLSVVRPSKQLGTLVASGALAAGLVAVQLFPFVEYLGLSVRALHFDYAFASRNSLSPASLIHFLVPPATGSGAHGFTTRYLFAPDVPWLVSIYPGALVLCLAAVGMAAPRPRRRVLFWPAVALIGVVLAMGRYLPVHPELYRWIPPFRAVRYPEKFIFLTAFALPVLAAAGVAGILAAGDSCRRTAARVLAAASCAYALAATSLIGGRGLAAACSGWLSGTLACGVPVEAAGLYAKQIGTVAVLCAIAWLLIGPGRRLAVRPAVVGSLITLLAALELLLAGRHLNPSVATDVYARPPWAAGVLAERAAAAGGQEATEERGPLWYRYRGTPLAAGMGRIAVVRGAEELTNLYLWYELLGPNLGQLFGYATQDGLQGVELRSVAETIDAGLHSGPAASAQLLRALSVRYYADATAAADSMPGLLPLAEHPELPARIFEVAAPRPRAYLVSRYEVIDDRRTALLRTVDPAFPLAEAVVLERAPGRQPTPGASGRVRTARFGLNRVELRTETDGPSLLVLTDRAYPGWRAIVNGEETPIHRAAGYVRAVEVPAGVAEVVFSFEPRSFRIGAIVSVVTLLLTVVLMVGLPASGHAYRARSTGTPGRTS